METLKDKIIAKQDEIYKILKKYIIVTSLSDKDWGELKALEYELSRLKDEGEDKLTCTDKCRWFNIGYGHCNFCIRQVKEHDCRDNFEPAEQSADKPMSPEEEIIIRLKKDDLNQCSYFTASEMYDFCKKHKIKVDEPRNTKGYFDRFIITLKTPEQKILFYGKYIDVLEKIASQFVGEKVTDNKLKGIIQELKDQNPYPESVFIPIPERKMRAVIKLLKDNGYSSDSLYGNWGRYIYDNCIKKIDEYLKTR